ncbi:aliphatic sulfonate ABC transporter substrate-binding protein [Desulfolithobacter dissulfuricans]|uniref:Aliphatic sulfonate ABC transporter substrate-binding protein n=1 Tax=Desulfolithobacter dissulfuricans TaxID=2795293 RepID=A0A915U5E3_9BACT|nr:ABC transporter substrate-binding protein [Desulfolithobacter dissulfuricans]BCO08977.1 aliphatic sulfonate ABC transporter substrate-binding protein [Desulfolithobacter dissulfuricans]
MKRLVLALIGLLCCAFVSSNADASQTKVKVAFATWVGYGPLYIAQEKGFFDKYGLDVELMIIDDESQYAAAMASGNIDALGNVLDREVIHYAKGTPEVVLFAMDESAGGDGIIATAEIKTLADLKGKNIGLDKSSTSYFFFLTALAKAGLPEETVTIHEMGASDAGAAFVAGRLDAAVSWEPWLSKAAERKGGHVLVSSKDFPRTIVDVFVMRRDYADKHPEAATGMTKAWFDAIAWYKQNPDEGNAIMARHLGEKPADIADMASGVSFFDRDGNLAFFDKSTDNNIYEVAARAGKFWKTKGILKKDLDVDGLITDQYIKAAAR